jgi:uncharacterized protein YjbI with pentapeptide repeats
MTVYNPEPKDIDINSSAAELRNYTLAFVSFLLYVLITAASTTHEQLLRISAVKLPLLDIDIPIVQFYLVSPLLILILHFHLLLQHFLFSQQFYSFDAALKLQYPDHADRVRFMKSLSGNLSLVHLLGGYQKTAVQILLAAILAICLLIFPLFDLWFLQAKFLPFHDNDYTNWQVLMVVIDCVMLLALLPKTFDEQDNALRWWLSVFSPLWWIKRLYLYGLRRFYHFYYQRGELRFLNRVLLNKTAIKTKLKKLIPRYQAILQAKIISFKQFLAISGVFIFVTVIFLLSVFVSTLPQFEYENKEKLFINDREKFLVGYLSECAYSDLYEYSSEYNDSLIYFYEVFFLEFFTQPCKAKVFNQYWTLLFTFSLHEAYYFFGRNIYLFDILDLYRNLYLSEKIITADESLTHELENTLNKESTLEKIVGIRLENRDLRYASFIDAKLPKADLRNTNLDGARLWNTQLQRADLRNADLQGTDFKNSQLQGTDFGGADAHLQSVNFNNAKLQGTNLEGAKLQDAYLEDTQLQGAYLKDTQLQGAYLYDVQLQGAKLSEVQLQGAYLEKIEYGNYINPETKKSRQTLFPIDAESKWRVPCLTDDAKLPICKKYNPADTETLNKVTSYWINDLACSDKWIAQGVIRNFLFDAENSAKFKTYLIPLLKKNLTDKDCTGIQNLPDDFKQQIKDSIKQQ